MEATDNLINEVANYLDITWEMSEAERSKLEGMITRGIAALERRIGSCDFTSETPEKTLLFNLVMYERSGSLDEFWTNYAGELMSMKVHNMISGGESDAETEG